MSRHLLRIAVAVAALGVSVGAAAGSASASTSAAKLNSSLEMRRLSHTDGLRKPFRLATHTGPGAQPRMNVRRNIVIGGGGPIYVEHRGCTKWFWVGAKRHYFKHCDTAQYMSGEWLQTDYLYYFWTGSRSAYYGHYRCWKSNVSPGGIVVIGTPPTTQCSWL